MKRISIVVLSVLGLLSLAACDKDPPRVDLSDKNILTLEVVLPEDVVATGMYPGENVEVDFIATIQTPEGEIETINYPDYRTFNITAAPGLTVEKDKDTVRLIADSSNLANWKSGYAFSYFVEGNAYPVQDQAIAMNFAGVTAVGSSGSHGSDGRNGSSGYNGNDGTSGRTGPDYEVHTLIANSDSGQWRLYKIVKSGSEPRWLILPADQPLRIYATGGNGGDGGNGGSGDYRSSSSSSCDNVYSGRRGDGGDGGDGGNGGRGGSISVFRLNADLLSDLELSVRGGNGGDGGRGGDGRSFCGYSGRNGHGGRDGGDGSAGLVSQVSVDLASLQAAFAGQDLSGLTF